MRLPPFDIAACFGLAVAGHLALWPADTPMGAEAAGEGGAHRISLAASAGGLGDLVAAWETPPDALTETAAPAAMALPDAPAPLPAAQPAPPRPAEPAPPAPAQTADALPERADPPPLRAAPPSPAELAALSAPAAPLSARPGLPAAQPSPPRAAAPTLPGMATAPDAPPAPLQPPERQATGPAPLAPAISRRPSPRPATLAPPPPEAPKPKPKARAKPKPKPKAAAAPAGANRAAQNAAGTGGKASAGHNGTAEASIGKGQSKRLMARWAGQIRSAIERRKRYPRGTSGSGTVRLSFSVTASGQLASARISRSSGNAALDAAALAALRSARLPRAPKGLGGATRRFTLPIAFSR